MNGQPSFGRREVQWRWEYYQYIKAIPGDDAFRRLGEGGCPLVKA